MDEKKEEKKVKLIFIGKKRCNASHYIVLCEKYPVDDIKGGDTFSLDALADLLNLRLDDQDERKRLNSVISGWRHLLYDARRLVTRKVGNLIVVEDDSAKVHHSTRLNKQAMSKLEKSLEISLSVNTSSLSEADRRQHEQNFRVCDGLKLARTKERVIPSLE